jgi:hypothetical protein
MGQPGIERLNPVRHCERLDRRGRALPAASEELVELAVIESATCRIVPVRSLNDPVNLGWSAADTHSGHGSHEVYRVERVRECRAAPSTLPG